MGDIIRKTMPAIAKSIDEKNHTITMYVSTGKVDRDNEIVDPKGWVLDNFKKHSPLVDSHDYKTVLNQIGKIIDVGVDSKGLWIRAQYFIGEGNLKADWAWTLAKHNSAAMSVGFNPIEKQDGKNGVKTVYTKQELLEVSQVIVPSQPDAVQDGIDNFALALKEFKGVRGDNMEVETKGVIPYKKHPLAPESTAWNAGKEVKLATVNDLKEMCAWYDSTKPDIKSSYKLPHHLVRNYVTVWRGVAASMAALFGARGGVNVPAKDRKGIYNHLAKHYQEFNKKVPEFKEYESDEEIFKACGITAEEFDSLTKNEDGDTINKTGRVLSGRIVEQIKTLIMQLDEVKAGLQEILKAEPRNLSLDRDGKAKEVLENLRKALKN